jgi:hypothetical protein
MTWLSFLIGALSTFRLTVLITKDKGPAFFFQKLREAPPKRSSLKQGISCPFCVSVWMAFPVIAFTIHQTPISNVFLGALALSGAAIILNQAFTKD